MAVSKLIDVHQHLWDINWFPPGHRLNFAIRAAKGRFPPRDPEEILPRVGTGTYDAEGNLTIQNMNECGIDTAIIMMMDWGIPFLARGEPDAPTPIEEINRLGLSLRKKFPGRFYGFCGVDPRREGALQLLERSVKEWGAIGYKPHPGQGYYANDPMLFPFYMKCMELDIPVLIHTGAYGTTAPEPVGEVAERFPDLTIIMAHVGMGGRFEAGGYWRAMSVAGSSFNIYPDLTQWQNSGALDERNIGDFWHVLNLMRNSVGAHRILWGTDLPFPRGRQFDNCRRWAEMFRNLPEEAAKYGVTFTDDEAEMIAHGNAERIMKLT